MGVWLRGDGKLREVCWGLRVENMASICLLGGWVKWVFVEMGRTLDIVSCVFKIYGRKVFIRV